MKQFMEWSSNPSKCKEVAFGNLKGCTQLFPLVSGISQASELSILGVTFQEDCPFTTRVHNKLIKANNCLFILRSLRKEGSTQVELDHLFKSLVIPNLTYGLSV